MRGAPASPRAFNQRQLTPDSCTIGCLAHGSVPKRGSRRPGGFHPASAQQQWDGSGLAVGPQLTSCSPWPWLSQDGATAWGWQRCHQHTRPRGAPSRRLWILQVLHTSPCLAQGKTPLVLPDFVGTLPPSLPGGGSGCSAAPARSFLPEAVLLGLNLPGDTLVFCKPGLGRSGIWEKLEQGAGKLRASASQHWVALEIIAGHRGTTKGH